MISSGISFSCTQYAIVIRIRCLSVSASLPVQSTQQPQPFFNLPRGLEGSSDCQAATVAARCGVAAFKSWHITFDMQIVFYV